MKKLEMYIVGHALWAMMLIGYVEASKSPITEAVINGVVSTGYFHSAKVCLDENANLQCDSDERQTLTDSHGNYQLSIAMSHVFSSNLIAEIMIDSSNQQEQSSFTDDIAYVLSAPLNQHTIISPITTLAASRINMSGLAVSDVLSDMNRHFNIGEQTNFLFHYLESQESPKLQQLAADLQLVDMMLAEKMLENKYRMNVLFPLIPDKDIMNYIYSELYSYIPFIVLLAEERRDNVSNHATKKWHEILNDLAKHADENEIYSSISNE